uniref:Uncharacterized protein n=1 Tax=Candidatus Methanogaster sp. ANME-2c ERB4 TaxID=2759911 RepID=A0A7G9Y9W3_9EURY|nr:hypothetical protein FIDFODCG_00005 [Methanosarcinales archaeon ANME-2c ERB4]QNO44162.1 hypothetical protein PBPCALNJ_00005 [Methanosarcinales archaeon ANME-2c ERB4]QNO44797.1 hypothetical protein HJJCBNBL_00009 [Methanosarcinales archaeon ANME-2c ERB4]
MKLFDTLLGRTELKKPKTEALFALSTAYISLEALGFKPGSVSGICFKPIESSRFSELESYLRELLRLSTSETGATCQFRTDECNYNWVILSDEDFENLITTTHLISETIIEHDFEERLLCSIFVFGDVYLIYSYKEGTFYPFAPLDDRKRDSNLEFRLRSAMEGELPIEEEMEKWYPIWEIPFQGRVLNAAKR